MISPLALLACHNRGAVSTGRDTSSLDHQDFVLFQLVSTTHTTPDYGAGLG